MSLKQVKSKIKSVDKIHKVTKAMEAVSAVKMRKSQERALVGRPYALAALSILKNLSSSLEGLDHPLTDKREVKKVCLVVVTSDKGLAGSLNSNVLREAQRVAKSYGRENTLIVPIGKKAKDHFSNRDFTLLSEYENSSETVDSEEAKEITKKITKSYLDKEFDLCYLIYSNFISTFEQKGVSRQFLPISLESVLEVVEGIAPARGKYSDDTEKEAVESQKSETHSYEVEPNGQEVLTELFPHLLSVELYHALLESRASEHSARMVAMKNASDKAQELSGELRLLFNKERQAQITAELSEIVSGIETT